MRRALLALVASLATLVSLATRANGLTSERLGVLYDRSDPVSTRVAQYYAARRHIPAANLVGLAMPHRPVLSRGEFAPLRRAALAALPTRVESLLLVWTEPYAVECMSITTAFAAGFHGDFCEPGCGPTERNPLFDSAGWLPADTIGWLPAMLLPSDDEALARRVIDDGVRSDGSHPPGTVYLVSTSDSRRNVRAAEYPDTIAEVVGRVAVVEIGAPATVPLDGAIAYFTGAVRVAGIDRIHFRPGAVADHLTSTGGVLVGGSQMSALAWLRAGATASFGEVSEPCNRLDKFPNTTVFLRHYLRGDTVLEAYWKSLAMPGQGLIIGEPLARPYGASSAE
ncbi:MAG: TIGR03790 family protein [Gammaproteobacteria bacterium]|nr:TIGR03790 family protein [Gammaproteobacteria bacterium]